MLMRVCSEGTLGRLLGPQGGGLHQPKPDRGALSPRLLPSPGLPSAVDGGITLEKEISKDELVAVLELYREVRGATSDIARLLKVLSQMERHEVRSLGAASDGGDRFRLSGGPPPLSSPQAS